jgi:hypothetical protein
METTVTEKEQVTDNVSCDGTEGVKDNNTQSTEGTNNVQPVESNNTQAGYYDNVNNFAILKVAKCKKDELSMNREEFNRLWICKDVTGAISYNKGSLVIIDRMRYEGNPDEGDKEMPMILGEKAMIVSIEDARCIYGASKGMDWQNIIKSRRVSENVVEFYFKDKYGNNVSRRCEVLWKDAVVWEKLLKRAGKKYTREMHKDVLLRALKDINNNNEDERINYGSFETITGYDLKVQDEKGEMVKEGESNPRFSKKMFTDMVESIEGDAMIRIEVYDEEKGYFALYIESKLASGQVLKGVLVNLHKR